MILPMSRCLITFAKTFTIRLRKKSIFKALKKIEGIGIWSEESYTFIAEDFFSFPISILNENQIVFLCEKMWKSKCVGVDVRVCAWKSVLENVWKIEGREKASPS